MAPLRPWILALAATLCACGPERLPPATSGSATGSGSVTDSATSTGDGSGSASSSGGADSTSDSADSTSTTGDTPSTCEDEALPVVRCLPLDCTDIEIIENDVIVVSEADLAALACVGEIHGDLSIVSTPLTNLTGLDNLTRVVGGVNISGNAALQNLDGLCSLTTVENPDGAEFGGHLFINDNAALADLDGLHNLGSVAFRMSVQGNAALTSLAGLGSLASVGDYLRVRELPGLVDLGGLEALQSFNRVAVEDNENLQSLCGLHQLTSATRIDVADNPALDDLLGLGALTTIESLRVENNGSLATLHGLEALTDAEQLLLSDNDALVSTAELLSLSSVTTLELRWNDALTALAMPTAPSIEHVELCANEALTGLADGPPSVTRTTILYNDALGDDAGDGMADAMGAATRKVANNAPPPHAPQLDPCPWADDLVCDEDESCMGDVCGTCSDDCCWFEPKNLCVTGSDGDDCPGPIGPGE